MVAEIRGTVAFAFPACLQRSAVVISLVSHVLSSRTPSRLSRAAFLELSWLIERSFQRVLEEVLAASFGMLA